MCVELRNGVQLNIRQGCVELNHCGDIEHTIVLKWIIGGGGGKIHEYWQVAKALP